MNCVLCTVALIWKSLNCLGECVSRSLRFIHWSYLRDSQQQVDERERMFFFSLFLSISALLHDMMFYTNKFQECAVSLQLHTHFTKWEFRQKKETKIVGSRGMPEYHQKNAEYFVHARLQHHVIVAISFPITISHYARLLFINSGVQRFQQQQMQPEPSGTVIPHRRVWNNSEISTQRAAEGRWGNEKRWHLRLCYTSPEPSWMLTWRWMDWRGLAGLFPVCNLCIKITS